MGWGHGLIKEGSSICFRYLVWILEEERRGEDLGISHVFILGVVHGFRGSTFLCETLSIRGIDFASYRLITTVPPHLPPSTGLVKKKKKKGKETT